ncbi:MAG: hypothetical protein MK066_13535 [Crocinitomicaceae bacterium]|nr:hypothetical protein [Crocinitomicaceae bacterium]
MGSKRIEELYQSTSLSDILARDTEFKEEEFDNSSDFDPVEIGTEDAESDFAIVEEVEPVPVKTIPATEEKPYDAVRNAQSLVYGLQGIEAPILNAVGIVKVRQSVGGKKVIDKMRAAVIKEMEGQDLTEKDQRLLESFKLYEKKMNLLGTTLIPQKEQTEKLIQAAIPYCEETKLNVNPGLGFYGHYFGELVSKITTIILT